MDSPDIILSKSLQAAKIPKDYHAALEVFYGSCDTEASAFLEDDGSLIKCKSGCDYCCYLRVGVKAHEVFLIAHHLHKNLSDGDKTSLLDSLSMHKEQVSKLTRIQHLTTNIPCPLMKDSQCSVYPVRPLSCRRYHSTDIGSCKYSYDNPKDETESRDRDTDLEFAWFGMSEMGNRVYDSLGLDSNSYELGMALYEAMANPKCEKRWRAGKKAFLTVAPTQIEEI